MRSRKHGFARRPQSRRLTHLVNDRSTDGATWLTAVALRQPSTTDLTQTYGRRIAYSCVMTSTVEPAPSDGEMPDGQHPTLASEFADLSDAVRSCLEQLARALRVNEADREATLRAIVKSATDTISPAEAAGINLLDKNQFVPQAVYGEAPPSWTASSSAPAAAPASTLRATNRRSRSRR